MPPFRQQKALAYPLAHNVQQFYDYLPPGLVTSDNVHQDIQQCNMHPCKHNSFSFFRPELQSDFRMMSQIAIEFSFKGSYREKQRISSSHFIRKGYI